MRRTYTIAALLLCASRVSAQDDVDLTPARLVGDPDPVVPELHRPQLVKRDHTTPTVLGASAAIVGTVGLVSAWSLYAARQNYRLTPRSVITDRTLSSWESMGAWSFWIGAGSSALLVTSEYLLLPESQDVPTLAWIAGGAGVVVAAVGVGYAVGGSHCAPTAVRPGADILLACSSGTADATFGPLLAMSAVPLINVPLVFLFRKAFAGAPESLSFGPGGVQVSGRF